MKNSKGISLIALIITIIVIIILAAIVLSSGGDTTNRAQLAVFSNNFSEYANRVIMDSLSIKQRLGVSQENVNDAQLYYMTANGLKTAKDDVETKDRMLPVGYVLPQTIRDIYKINSNEVVAYVIDDYNITHYNKENNDDGSAGYEFYGDSNGDEYHFITSNGHVFTLPGFALTLEDGTIQFYISNEKGAYYIVKGNSGKSVGQMNINGEKITDTVPILADSFKSNMHGIDTQNTPKDAYTFTPGEGRYTKVGVFDL